MSRRRLSSLIVLVVAAICLSTRTQINLVENIPSVFQGSGYKTEWRNGTTLVYKDNVEVDPITHDDKYLYILHGTGSDFVRYNVFEAYKVDEVNREIVVIENLFNFKPRNKITYQMIKVPKWRYQKIVSDHKIRVRIKCANAFQLIEYNFQNQSYATIAQCSEAK